MTTRVVNLRFIPLDSVSIGRPGPWGKPVSHRPRRHARRGGREVRALVRDEHRRAGQVDAEQLGDAARPNVGVLLRSTALPRRRIRGVARERKATMNDEIVNWIGREQFDDLCQVFARFDEHGWYLPRWLARWGEAMGYWEL